eukprot:354013-Chlamydomonas_euryale.AAC.3
MGLINAALQGTALAYRNRNELWQAGQELRKLTGRKRPRTNNEKTGITATYAGGNGFSKRKSTFRRTRKPRTNAQKINMNKVMIKSLMQPAVCRAQGITQYDTDVGSYQLWQSNTATGVMHSPVHVWDPTSIPNRGNDEAAGYQFGWDGVANTANMFKKPLGTQDSTGSTSGGSKW